MHQQAHVVAPLAERREVNPYHVEAVIQVFAKFLGGHELFRVLVGRGDDAHVHVERLVAADALEFAVLQHAQDFRLRRQRHVADFVEKNRPLVALLELADPPVGRARERALFVAEQFALQQILRNRRAVDRQERFSARRLW